MVELVGFKQAAADFNDMADFATVYISEAHATDGWSFAGNRYKIKQHTSLQERLLAASILLEDEGLKPPGTFLIDKMENNAEVLYGGLPERLYIVLNGIIVYAGRKGPKGYQMGEVKEWLERYRAKSK